MTPPQEDAPKHDTGKLPWHLFPFDAAEEVVRVYEFGAQKYYAHGWRDGFHWSRIFAAVCRHLFAWFRGEDRDEESGLPHLAHAGWGILCLLDMQRRGVGRDDRWEEQHEDTEATRVRPGTVEAGRAEQDGAVV